MRRRDFPPMKAAHRASRSASTCPRRRGFARLEASCAAAVKAGATCARRSIPGVFRVLARDAQSSLAAIELVLAQPAISSQLVDNLNASMHLRALLADLFLIAEILELRQSRQRRWPPIDWIFASHPIGGANVLPASSRSFEHPRNAGALANPDASVQLENPACGDILKLTLKLPGNRIEEIRFLAKGCVASMACASALTELVQGKTIEAGKGTRREECCMLSADCLPPHPRQPPGHGRPRGCSQPTDRRD